MHRKAAFRLNAETGTYSTRRHIQPDEILQEAQRILLSRIKERPALKDPAAVKSYLANKFAGKEREEFLALLLDTQHRVIATVTLSVGTIDGATVYPREVVKTVLEHNAAAVIFSHQHPSGVAEPSSADRSLTERLKAALAQIDVRVLDHIVVGGTNCVSFAERGWI
jgi:DNA repair protein RadC